MPSLTLGSNAVTPLEMASAYASFAAGGVYHKPRIISKITFADSDRVVKVKSKGKRVMSDGVAAEVTRILGENIRRGTGTPRGPADDRPEAGKTGTTDNIRDAWFCGYTPDLATCVWIGYPISEKYPLHNVEGVGTVYGGTLPALIWHGYMEGALAAHAAARLGAAEDRAARSSRTSRPSSRSAPSWSCRRRRRHDQEAQAGRHVPQRRRRGRDRRRERGRGRQRRRERRG